MFRKILPFKSLLSLVLLAALVFVLGIFTKFSGKNDSSLMKNLLSIPSASADVPVGGTGEGGGAESSCESGSCG